MGKTVLVICLWFAVAHADPEQAGHAVALLPLDADAKLELYGEPVASELSHVLVAAGFEVVLVRPPMAVPSQARLIVSGRINAGSGTAVELTVSLRDAITGRPYETVSATAPTQTAMDHAAEELSTKVVPAVRTRLATLVEADRIAAESKQKPIAKPVVQPKPPQMFATMLVRTSGIETLAKPLAAALEPWATRRHHTTKPIVEKVTPAFVAAQHADFSIELDVKSAEIDRDADVPLATAQVHIRIVDAQAVVFDRTIVTDTIVGEKKLDDAKLLERVAREVLLIADPNVKRRISTWY